MTTTLNFILTVTVWCMAGVVFVYYWRQAVREQRPPKERANAPSAKERNL